MVLFGCASVAQILPRYIIATEKPDTAEKTNPIASDVDNRRLPLRAMRLTFRCCKIQSLVARRSASSRSFHTSAGGYSRPSPPKNGTHSKQSFRVSTSGSSSLAIVWSCCGQGKTDTQLSNPSKFLIFIGTDIPEIRVLPSAVVEHLDVSDNIVARLLTRGVIMVRRPLTF